MSDPTYNSQTISAYLLGSLSEAESERLDELSIADDEFADALSSAEKELIDSYVQRELSGNEVNRFEAHYLASPLRRDKVDFATALQVLGGEKLGALAEGTQSRDRFSTDKKRGWLAVFYHFGAPRRALQWGFAIAAIVLLIGGGLLLFQNVRLRQQMSQTQARRDELQRHEQELQKEVEDQRAENSKAEQELAQVRAERERLDQELKKQSEQERTAQRQSSPGQTSVASFILTPSLRGAAQVQSVSVPPNTGRVAMQLNLEPNDYRTYRVALIDQSSHQTLWRSGKLTPSSRGNAQVLNVSFSSTLLKPQAYTLQVSGISARGKSELISDYPFKVVK